MFLFLDFVYIYEATTATVHDQNKHLEIPLLVIVNLKTSLYNFNQICRKFAFQVYLIVDR